MRELSLHILDLIENSIRAGASSIAVTVEERPDKDSMTIAVEDNGPGLSVSFEKAVDPFYTTKEGKRTGLGLSLFKAAAEQANGSMTLGKSALGGLAVEAKMQLSHIDRYPLGDLAATLSSVVCTNPDLDLSVRIASSGGDCDVRVTDIANEFCAHDRCGLAIARRVSERVKKALTAVSVHG
ncbi:MAG: hypothetical protein QG656_361 [Candidatus Hydrogenedentes bacterium]|nr:hypothetical protein [Candidatus Hydrogenedentota bacterium]